MNSAHLRVLFTISTVSLTATLLFAGQQPTDKTNADDSAARARPLPPNSRQAPLSDYVPCLFNHNEEITMHALLPRRNAPEKIDEATAIQLYSATTSAISKLRSDPKYVPKGVDEFLSEYRNALNVRNLVGLTPGQAELEIYNALLAAGQQTDKQLSESIAPVLVISRFLSPSLKDTDAAANEVVKAISDAAGKVKSQTKATRIDSSLARQLIDETTKAIDEFKDNPSYDKQGVMDFEKAYLRALGPSYVLTDEMMEQGLILINRAAQSARNYVNQERELIGMPPSAKGEPVVGPTSIDFAPVIAAIQSSATDVIEATTTQPFQPPNDVSCSMSILGWKETSDTFGRRVANTFVAIQVTVRNLNAKNEFLIHDIQVAIDTGIRDDEFGRFQAGRDKLLVRAVAQRGQSDDGRNLVLHSLEAVGAIAGSASIIGSAEFKTAVAVFQGAFIPGFTNIFPDHTVEQLNHINDLVFSASSTSKVLVPIQGSVPLVTFIAEKPLEQLPFAWCGYNSEGFRGKRIQYCELDDKLGYRIDGNRAVKSVKRGGQPGTADQKSPIDRASTLQPQQQLGVPSQTSSADEESAQKPPAAQPSGSDGPGAQSAGLSQKAKPPASSTPDYEQFWDNLEYRKWKARALEILQRRTFVVIGGVHIQQIVAAAKINNMDCPTLNSGPADFSQLQDGLFTCSATGENLGLVASVTLEKGGDKPAGKIKPAKDGNSAALTFDPLALSDFSGVFTLYLVDQAGTKTNSGESVLLSPMEPVITKVEEPSLDVSKASATVTLDGKHLDQLNDVSLVPDETGGNAVKGTLQSSAETTAKVAFTSANLITGKQYHVRYSMKLEPSKQIDLKSVTVRAK